MPRYAVHPDDLEAAAALTTGDRSALAAVHHLVGAACRDAVVALGPSGGPLVAAVENYGQVESMVAVALAEAVEVLSGGLASAAEAYARVDAVGASGFGVGRAGT
jgi:hypothetical protein